MSLDTTPNNVYFPSTLMTPVLLFRSIKPGQHYKIGVELTLPTSPINKNIGVFMVNLCRHPDRASMRYDDLSSAIPIVDRGDHNDVILRMLFRGAKYNLL